MKAVVCLFLLNIYSISLSAQFFDWAFQAGGAGAERGLGISNDAQGNIYAISNLNGNGMYGNIPFTAAFAGNNIVAKHSPQGQVIWAYKTYTTHCYAISTDPEGNSYIGGICGNAIFMGNNSSASVTYSGGQSDAFVVKYDSAGHVLWARVYGTADAEETCTAIKHDEQGNVYATGQSYDHNGPGGEIRYNTIILKYDSLGNLLWERNTNWSGSAGATRIAVDDSGNAYITGAFYHNIDFGGVSLNTNETNSVFITKYNLNGQLLWAISDGGLSEAEDICYDGKGNLYLTGWYQSPSTFGSTTLGGGTLRARMFVAKYDTSGTNLWATGSSIDVRGWGIASDTAGNCFVTGACTTDTTFLGEGAHQIALFHSRNCEIFVAKYEADGDLAWAITPSTSPPTYRENYVTAISADKFGNCFVTGMFSENATFGDTTIYSPYASKYYDVFIVKVKDLHVSEPVTIEELEETFSIAVYPNPSQGLFNINCSGDNIHNVKITVRNALSQLVYSFSEKNNSNNYSKEIDLNNNSRGLYFLEIQVDDKRELRKVVLY